MVAGSRVGVTLALHDAGCKGAAEGKKDLQYSTFGAACTEVELNLLTGERRVLRADVLHDAGDSMSPAVDMGQVCCRKSYQYFVFNPMVSFEYLRGYEVWSVLHDAGDSMSPADDLGQVCGCELIPRGNRVCIIEGP